MSAQPEVVAHYMLSAATCREVADELRRAGRYEEALEATQFQRHYLSLALRCGLAEAERRKESHHDREDDGPAQGGG